MPEVSADSDLKQRVTELERERDEYKKLYVSMLEQMRRLEAGVPSRADHGQLRAVVPH